MVPRVAVDIDAAESPTPPTATFAVLKMPGMSLAISRGLRPLTSMLSICLPTMASERSTLSVCSMAAVAEISTVSVTTPTVSDKSAEREFVLCAERDIHALQFLESGGQYLDRVVAGKSRQG